MSDMADRTVRVATIIRSNTAPAAGAPTVAPNPTTGEVTGVVNVKDYDGDSITVTYSQPSKGSVSYNASTGAYTYNHRGGPCPGLPHTRDDRHIHRQRRRLARRRYVCHRHGAGDAELPAGVSPIAVGSHPIDITVAGTACMSPTVVTAACR